VPCGGRPHPPSPWRPPGARAEGAGQAAPAHGHPPERAGRAQHGRYRGGVCVYVCVCVCVPLPV